MADSKNTKTGESPNTRRVVEDVIDALLMVDGFVDIESLIVLLRKRLKGLPEELFKGEVESIVRSRRDIVQCYAVSNGKTRLYLFPKSRKKHVIESIKNRTPLLSAFLL